MTETSSAPRVTRRVLRALDEVWAALADPHTYPEWLAGCRAVRTVEVGWPRQGTRFHHRVGLAGPLAVDDHTEAIASSPPHHLALEVRFRPFGRGRVDFWLADESRSGMAVTRIDMDEVPIGTISPARPVVAPLIVARNRASLNAFVAFLNDPT